MSKSVIVPQSAFTYNFKLLRVLVKPSAVNMIHNAVLLPDGFSIADLREKGSFNYTIFYQLVKYHIFKMEKLGKNSTYTFNHERFETICGAAARVLPSAAIAD